MTHINLQKNLFNDNLFSIYVFENFELLYPVKVLALQSILKIFQDIILKLSKRLGSESKTFTISPIYFFIFINSESEQDEQLLLIDYD